MKGPEGKAVFSGIVPVGPEGNETAIGPVFAVWSKSFLYRFNSRVTQYLVRL
jgi:hypothetical protein